MKHDMIRSAVQRPTLPGTRRTTLNAYGEKIFWIGRWTEHEYAVWLRCESEDHLRSCLDFQLTALNRKLEISTAKDHGWPKSMSWQIRLQLFYSNKSGWTPKRDAHDTIGVNIQQVMRAYKDLEEWEFAHRS